MKGRVFILVIVFVTAFSACRNSSKKNDEFRLAGSETMHEAIVPDNDFNLDFSVGFSSPIEIANLLQVRGVPFSQRYLASSLEASNQVSSFDKALAMGILGANLGYLNIYEKTGNSIEVLASIKKLAEGINVGQFFDFETIKRLSLSKSNLDSLLFLSVDSYNKIDKYLTDNNRGQLSALIITGAWIEAQYLVTQVIKQYPDDLLRDRIGEQKQFLNDLIRMMEPYCNLDRQYAGLCSKLKEISDKYDDVEISFTEGEPVSMEQDGGLVITQTETSEIEMTDKQLEDIIKITEQIRNALIVNK
ncbi:MAG TPA: hypothetical protein PK727_06345 [Bacteroidales bacterium]|jgi:hypothetical protein|nr:hypothetical protein [Bacteroidales bacterium]HOG56934.1 hypothetical protein [Bacteroidales bacterium]HQB86677.1 hypothetical protein [Bacteroidales bacterium]